MKKKGELTRRQMLGGMAATTLGAVVAPKSALMGYNTNRDSNKEVARSLLKAWNDLGESHLPSNLVSPKLVTYYPRPLDRAARGQGNALYETVLPRKGFQDQHFKEQIVIADDEHVFIAWEVTGTHKGSLYGLPATGRTVTAYGSDVIRVVDGRIVEHLNYYSKTRMQVLARLGLLHRDQQRFMIANGLLGRNRVIGRANVQECLDLFGNGI
jgi:predicted ester cyclase